MPTDLEPGDRAALESIVGRLEAAWNAMDGAAFAADFADDADVVTKEPGGWEIAALHTTVAAGQGAPR